MKNVNVKMGMMEDMMKGMGGTTSFSTPEMKGLFEEWSMALEEEIIVFVKEKGRTNPSDIAAKLLTNECNIIW